MAASGYITNDFNWLMPGTVIESHTSYTGCEAFVCSNSTFFGGCLDEAKPSIVVNRDIAVYPGVFDVRMSFSHTVQVEGRPFLTFETGNHDARARYSPSSVQYVDVGLDGSSHLNGGQFQLSYAMFKTDCIDYDVADSVGFQSMKRR